MEQNHEPILDDYMTTRDLKAWEARREQWEQDNVPAVEATTVEWEAAKVAKIPGVDVG